MPTGSVTPAGGGGSSVVYESGYYEQSGSPTTILNGGLALLPFDDFAGGTAMLNITAPTQPLVLKAGLFVVTVEVSPTTNMTVGGTFSLSLTLDLGGEAIEMRGGATADQGICLVSDSWVMAAGAQLRLSCSNFDGVASRAFNITNATVSRVGPA